MFFEPNGSLNVESEYCGNPTFNFLQETVPSSNYIYNPHDFKHRVRHCVFVRPAYQDDTFWSVPFGVSLYFMVWARFLRWAFFYWCISFWVAIKMEKGVFLTFPLSSEKKYSLQRFCVILENIINIHQFINF